MGQGQGQAPVPGTLIAHPAAPPVAAARFVLERYAAHLPDLSGITVLVPNQRAGRDFARALAQLAGRAALIPPDITPLKHWAERHADGAAEPPAARLARLGGVLRQQRWLGAVDTWALAEQLLQLADDLSANDSATSGAARLRARLDARLEREIALVETVSRTMNGEGRDPQARYARALDAAARAFAAAPRPVVGFSLGPLSALERRFLERCAACAPLDLVVPDVRDPRVHSLATAWRAADVPLGERARALGAQLAASPLADLRVAAAPHLEGEARSVLAWLVEQLAAGRRHIALIALDRQAARRVRALAERLDILIADETGWTLSTTAAAAVVDRWLTCVADDFPHVELLDLLKSPFVLGDPAAREDAVHAFELTLRRRGVARGMAAMQQAARESAGALPSWLVVLAEAARLFPRGRTTLGGWTRRLLDSLDALEARAALERDAAGRAVLDTLGTLAREVADDRTAYGFAEWRRWLDRMLAAASFCDPSVDSPVVLTALPHARGRLFDAVALIGADARHLPAPPAAGLFTDATRAALGLATARDAMDDATEDLIGLVAAAPTLFSWQTFHGDAANPASPLVVRLDALHRAAWGSPLATQAPGEPPAHTAGPVPSAVRPAPVVPATLLPRRYSATAYQVLVDCPYRFFVERVLGIRILDEADEPLDKSDYGTLLHRILKDFHDGDPPRERAAALERLAALSRAAFAALPAYTAAAWRTRWEGIEAAYIDAWLAWTGLGWRYMQGEAGFSRSHPVAGLGAIELAGVLDRVDERRLPDGAIARTVFDYKTGSANALKQKLKDPAEAVQLPFYAWLADAAAAYLPIDEAPVAPLTLDGDTDVEAIGLRLPRLIEALAAGAPLPANGVDAICAHCAARGLCRKGTWHG